jgi:hypothetical protein
VALEPRGKLPGNHQQSRTQVNPVPAIPVPSLPKSSDTATCRKAPSQLHFHHFINLT